MSRLVFWRQQFSQAFSQYKWSIIILVVLGFASGFLEGIGINALIPLFSLITGNAFGANDFISRLIERFFSFLNINFQVEYLLIFIAILFVFKFIVLFISNYLKYRIAFDYENKVRDKLFKQTIGANWSYLLKQKIGHLEKILMLDVEKSALLLEYFSSAILMVTSLSVYILIAVNISWKITLATLVLGLIISLIFKPFLKKKRQFARQVSQLNKDIAHFVNENIIGIKTIKSSVVGRFIVKKGEAFFAQLRKLSLKTYLISNLVSSFTQMVGILFIVILFAIFYRLGGLNFAAFAAVVYLIEKIFNFVEQIQGHFHKINHSLPFLQNVLAYESQSNESREDRGENISFSFQNELVFKNVDFSYNQEDKILDNLNFVVKKNQTIGLIGSSGAGKTTIVDLILRLFNPTGGEILLDNKNIKEINLKSWREHLGYVAQDIFLLNDSILNNIKFYNENITQEQAERAAQMTNIYDFIQTLPQKFETNIGERGIKISVGQRQRIILARVLANAPEFLILDEATSALDNESEAKIQKVIEELKGKVTVLIIAHRLSTVLGCDQLLVLDRGKIIEQGAPAELLRDQSSYFYRMFNLKSVN